MEKQKNELQILGKLITSSDFDEGIKKTLYRLIEKVVVTEKTAKDESISSLIKMTCYPDRKSKKELNYKEMKTLIHRIQYSYKYLG